jgi:3-phosphoshikimate 1-carboxyvinyltransferase
VLLLNALSIVPQIIDNLADCDDTNVMINALQSQQNEIDIQAAGTAMRFLTAYFAGEKGHWTLTGTERMQNRPVKILVEALNALGAQVAYKDKDGFPPLRINGQVLRGGEISLDGSVSSQYISALIMVAPRMVNGLRLNLTGQIISKPYLQLTVKLMREFGVEVFEEGNTLTIPKQTYKPVPFTVESDWSAASYWYEMVALSEIQRCKDSKFKISSLGESDSLINSITAGSVRNLNDVEVTLTGLFDDSLQGDARMAELFDQLGVGTTFVAGGVVLKRKERTLTDALIYDFTDMPDMAQTLAVTCSLLDIPFCFSGLQSLKIKETDRLAALRNELAKLGYLLTEKDGKQLQWNGERTEPVDSPLIRTYDDHRMAMAFAPIALQRNGGIRIEDIGVVSKSYPRFWDDLRDAGFQLESS